jgi:hypothetical protein
VETKENNLLIDNFKESRYRYYDLPSRVIIKGKFPRREYQRPLEDIPKEIFEKKKEESGININFSKEAIEKLRKKPTERITTIEEEKKKQLTEEIEKIKEKWEEERKKQLEKIISPEDISQKKSPEDLVIIRDENKEQRYVPIKYVPLPIIKKEPQEQIQRTPTPFERFHGGLLLQQTSQTTEISETTKEKKSKSLTETITSMFKKKPQEEKTTEITQELPQRKSWGLLGFLGSMFTRKPTEKIQESKKTDQLPTETERKSQGLIGTITSMFRKKLQKEEREPLETVKSPETTETSEITKGEKSKGFLETITSFFRRKTQKKEKLSETEKPSEKITSEITKEKTPEQISKETIQTLETKPEPVPETPKPLPIPTERIIIETGQKEIPKEQIQTEEKIKSTERFQEEKRDVPGITHEERMKIRKETPKRRFEQKEDQTPTKEIITETPEKKPIELGEHGFAEDVKEYIMPNIELEEGKKEIQEQLPDIEKGKKIPKSKDEGIVEEVSKIEKPPTERMTESVTPNIEAGKTEKTVQKPGIIERLLGKFRKKEEKTTSPTSQITKQVTGKDISQEESSETNIFKGLWGGISSLFRGKTPGITTTPTPEIEGKTPQNQEQTSTLPDTGKKEEPSGQPSSQTITEEKTETKEQKPVTDKYEFVKEYNIDFNRLFETKPTQKLQQETKKTDETLKHVVGYGGSLASGLVGGLLFGAWGIPISIIGSAASSILGRTMSGEKDIIKGEDLIKHIAVGTGTSLVGLLIRHLMNSNKRQERAGKVRRTITRRIRG